MLTDFISLQSTTTTPPRQSKRTSAIETKPTASPPASTEVFEKNTSKRTSSQLQAELLRKEKAYTHLERTNRILRRANYEQQCEIEKLKVKTVELKNRDIEMKYYDAEYGEEGKTVHAVPHHRSGNDLRGAANGVCVTANRNRTLSSRSMMKPSVKGTLQISIAVLLLG
ncbi:hypothetical protein I302_103212 [Kwoniella bestiolae CBS 10118]|uniref:Uncharacterized protein n=1 Tax=Kwoniella bestiolae CBS 10118 TaxID=1296100 RepID=A0A1B9G7T0_9TREE|nr:hypothetical protein I302_01911 [Kwoniella bestiolae CBS 10118]OCF27076.1 hypothetical protein I302_01911 [Kwoniella bestiolae CBS 10118]